jgi:hypothetical protein
MSENQIIQFILDEIKEMKQDIKNILSFQNKILGVLVACSSLFTVLGFLISLFYQ